MNRYLKYDWSEIQRYYDEGHSIRECMARFGFCVASWYKAQKRGVAHARPPTKPLEVLLATSRSRVSIKRRLLRAGLLQNRCSACGIDDWLDKPISIQIDHANGINDDWRLENLRMLCPNCHSQTETWGRKNKSRRLQANPLQDRPGPV